MSSGQQYLTTILIKLQKQIGSGEDFLFKCELTFMEPGLLSEIFCAHCFNYCTYIPEEKYKNVLKIPLLIYKVRLKAFCDHFKCNTSSQC